MMIIPFGNGEFGDAWVWAFHIGGRRGFRGFWLDRRAPAWPGYAPIFVANDLGYFKELGISVTMNFDDDRSDVLAAMARGDIEIDMRTVGEHQGRPRNAKTPGIIIGTIDESLGGDGAIVDDTIKSGADMKSKAV